VIADEEQANKAKHTIKVASAKYKPLGGSRLSAGRSYPAGYHKHIIEHNLRRDANANAEAL
jgi:hypothetical protein